MRERQINSNKLINQDMLNSVLVLHFLYGLLKKYKYLLGVKYGIISYVYRYGISV